MIYPPHNQTLHQVLIKSQRWLVQWSIAPLMAHGTFAVVINLRIHRVAQSLFQATLVIYELTEVLVLISCARRHYDGTDLNQLLKTVSSKRILDVVKDIGFYNSL